ncbi:MAG TPA: hypothetical protein VFA92_02625, partial [Candidatus Binatia bacterium]|nr:hypothetical protein [Candidatus Binatia bacterium]
MDGAAALPLETSGACETGPAMRDVEESRRSGMWANLGARLTSEEEGRATVEACLTVERHGFSAGGAP